MRDTLFHLERVENVSIQSQIREMLVSAILGSQLAPGEALPSSRRMSQLLGVSRNTVSLAYQGLVDDGYLIARERSGFYVNPEMVAERRPMPPPGPRATPTRSPAWEQRYRVRPGEQDNISKPHDWQRFPYPFIYGQVDQALFPIAAWRECSRQALGRKGMDAWTSDAHAQDDPMLVEQIRTRLLSRRGIMARDNEVLITMGAQNALYLLAALLLGPKSVVAMEEPGYPDVRNIIRLKTANVRPIPVDSEGLPVDGRLDGCDYLFVTPSHQFPTTTTMPLRRRHALLEAAAREDFVIFEDDYEFETNYVSSPTPALKSLDTQDRVLYIGSLSKTMFPGLRLGYLVGPAPLIREARALRRLMLRHAPNTNQRTAALFLALGHHDALIHRLHRVYRERWAAMGQALSHHLPDSTEAPSFGGTSYWVQGPTDLDAEALARAAAAEGLLIEPGRVNFHGPDAPRQFFRLGFSSIPLERIEPGIARLAELIRRRAGRAA